MESDYYLGWGRKAEYQMQYVGASLAVHWLRVCTSNAGAQVQSLAGKLRSHMLCGMAKKKKIVWKHTSV